MKKIAGIVIARHSLLKGTLRLQLLTQDQGVIVGCVRKEKAASAFMEGSYVEGSCVRESSLPYWSLQQIEEPVFLHICDDFARLLTWKSALDMCTALSENTVALATYTALLRLNGSMRQETVQWKKDYIQFELNFLSNMGYGLSLDRCAVTGEKESLAYISPRTGCAVIETVGQPYAEKLLDYSPAFAMLKDKNADLSLEQFRQALVVLNYFIQKNVRKKLMRNQLHELLSDGT